MGTKLRTNIQKKIRVHQRKIKKEAKKLRVLGLQKKGSKMRSKKKKRTICTSQTCSPKSSR